MSQTPTVDYTMLHTLRQQAEDAHCAVPLCKPFRADILAQMCSELLAWKRTYHDREYDSVLDQIVVKDD